MTKITKKSPNQIFSVHKFPKAWETVFKERLDKFPDFFQADREAAWKLAKKIEMPDRKDESWRWMDYSDLDLERLETQTKKVFSLQFQLVELGDDETPANWNDLPKGVIVSSLKFAAKTYPELVRPCLERSKIAHEGKFAALACAMARKGLFVYVPENTSVEDLIKVGMIFQLGNNIVWTHSIICLAANAEASIELDWVNNLNSGDGLHNGILEVFLGEGARLQLDERQHFGKNSWNISHATASLDKDAQLIWNSAIIGAKSSKNFIKADLFGTGSNALLQGIMFPEEGQVVNADTRQNHWDASTTSNLLFRSVAANHGSSIWHGMIYVDPLAQQTDAYQTNNNLILDDSADVKSIPGLEIPADDVKCSHGATVGRIDDEELYYLQARGIPEKDAQKLIVQGFFNQVMQSFKLESTRESLLDMIVEKMERF